MIRKQVFGFSRLSWVKAQRIWRKNPRDVPTAVTIGFLSALAQLGLIASAFPILGQTANFYNPYSVSGAVALLAAAIGVIYAKPALSAMKRKLFQVPLIAKLLRWLWRLMK